MKEVHISIFNPDNLRLNELYYKLNQYTSKVTADLFEPNMYFHVDGKDIFDKNQNCNVCCMTPIPLRMYLLKIYMFVLRLSYL